MICVSNLSSKEEAFEVDQMVQRKAQLAQSFSVHVSFHRVMLAMETRLLGKTGLKLSKLGFGASPLGGHYADVGQVAQEQANLAVQKAVNLGINYFDTAPFYGLTKSESVLGKALQGIPREKFIVSTKVGRYGDTHFDFSPEKVVSGFEQSMARLGLDKIDMCIVHDIEFGDISKVATETIPALRSLQEAGKIGFVGVSGLPLEIFSHILDLTDIDFILSYCHYTMFDTTLKPFYDEHLKEKGIGVINAAPLSMGLLTNQGPSPWHPAPPNIKSTCQEAALMCSSAGVNISDLALHFSLQSDFVASTLVGMGSEAVVESNVNAMMSSFPTSIFDHCMKKLDAIRDVSWPSGNLDYNNSVKLA